MIMMAGISIGILECETNPIELGKPWPALAGA